MAVVRVRRVHGMVDFILFFHDGEITLNILADRHDELSDFLDIRVS